MCYTEMLYSSQHSHDIHVAKCHNGLMVHNICCCFFKYQKTVHKSVKCLKFSKILSPWHYKMKVLLLELSDSSWHVRKITNRKPWYAAHRISLAVAFKEDPYFQPHIGLRMTVFSNLTVNHSRFLLNKHRK